MLLKCYLAQLHQKMILPHRHTKQKCTEQRNNTFSAILDRVTVPSKYYKVIYDFTGIKKMIAFILPNEKGTKQLSEYVVTVDSVHNVTGIDFFPCLPDTLRNRLEETSDISKWDFNITSTYSSRKSIQYNSVADTSNVTSGQKQCIAITKSGKRCKRLAIEGSDYCWQHQKY
jgi:endonuclease G